MRRVFFVFALLLAGCQTTGSSTIGSGPITLSPAVQEYLDRYMNEKRGAVFAVAVDGYSWASYWRCPAFRCQVDGGARRKTIEDCELNSNGVPCKVYAVWREIVWDFDGPAGQ